MPTKAVPGLLLLYIASGLSAQAPPVLKIPDGTALRLSLTQELSSATNAVDDPVHFEVVEDVKVAGVVAIPRGSTAAGHAKSEDSADSVTEVENISISKC
jgi:hypothetical protein